MSGAPGDWAAGFDGADRGAAGRGGVAAAAGLGAADLGAVEAVGFGKAAVAGFGAGAGVVAFSAVAAVVPDGA